jgi:hypothetical protein
MVKPTIISFSHRSFLIRTPLVRRMAACAVPLVSTARHGAIADLLQGGKQLGGSTVFTLGLELRECRSGIAGMMDDAPEN